MSLSYSRLGDEHSAEGGLPLPSLNRTHKESSCCGLMEADGDINDAWMTWARGCRSVVRVFLTPLRICYDWSDKEPVVERGPAKME